MRCSEMALSRGHREGSPIRPRRRPKVHPESLLSEQEACATVEAVAENVWEFFMEHTDVNGASSLGRGLMPEVRHRTPKR